MFSKALQYVKAPSLYCYYVAYNEASKRQIHLRTHEHVLKGPFDQY